MGRGVTNRACSIQESGNYSWADFTSEKQEEYKLNYCHKAAFILFYLSLVLLLLLATDWVLHPHFVALSSIHHPKNKEASSMIRPGDIGICATAASQCQRRLSAAGNRIWKEACIQAEQLDQKSTCLLHCIACKPCLPQYNSQSPGSWYISS